MSNNKTTKKKTKKKKYLSNANLLRELKISHEQDEMTEELAKMFMLLVDRYASKIRFRVTESFKEDMKGFAIATLIKGWKSFNADKYEKPNPFAYFTQCAKNAFYHVQNQERKHKDIKNEMLIARDMSPSFAYQAQYEEEQRLENDNYEGLPADSDYDIVVDDSSTENDDEN